MALGLTLASVLSAQTRPEEVVRVVFDPQESGVSASFRGLSSVSAEIAWAGGNAGTVLRTGDGGRSWRVLPVAGADSLDFRDIEAFPGGSAYLMSAGPGAKSRIYKTIDAGRSWSLLLTNPEETGFFDGMAFRDKAHGMLYSDPVDGQLLLFNTSDGRTWSQVNPEACPRMNAGEYGFAASGTGICTFGTMTLWVATGGSFARIFRSDDAGGNWRAAPVPLAYGKQSAGIFSLAFRDGQNGIAVGGDYRAPANTAGTLARTTDGGVSWSPPEGAGAMGYRSAVAYVPGTNPPMILAAGSHGISLSTDDGLTWTRSDSVGFNSLSFGPAKESGWAAGSDGRLAKIVVGP